VILNDEVTSFTAVVTVDQQRRLESLALYQWRLAGELHDK